GGDLPAPVDLLMTSFASGASGYPVCWADQYSTQEIEKQIAKKRSLWSQAVLDMVRITGAKAVMPFAGYFEEAHPGDRDVRELNQKNSARDIAESLARRAPEVATWTPEAGDVFDLAAAAVTVRGEPRHPDHDFDAHTRAIGEALEFAPLSDLRGVAD